ncbi:uncharacterized protein [Nicotiana sylvestris]
MSRFQKNIDNIMKHEHKICQKILLKLEQNKSKVAECIATKADQFHYQIEDNYFRLFSIDLKEMTCSCRRWELTGIPCHHAIATIWVKKDEPEMYVPECYTTELYMKSYGPSILPINSSEECPKIGVEPALPPIYKTQPGRPKKLRKRGSDETSSKELDHKKHNSSKTSRKGKKKNCGTCGKTGHNSRRCPIIMQNHQEDVQQQLGREGSSSEPSNVTEVTRIINESQVPMQSSSSFVTKQTINQLNQHMAQPRE